MGIRWIPNTTSPPAPRTIAQDHQGWTHSRSPTLTCQGSTTGVTGTGKPSQGWEIQRHSKVLACQASHGRERNEEEGAGELMCQIKQQKMWIPGSQHQVTITIFSLTAESLNGTVIPSEVPAKGTAWKQPRLHILLRTKDIYWNQDWVVGYLWSAKGLHLLDNLFIMNNSSSFI